MGRLLELFKSEKTLLLISFVFIAVIICYCFYDITVDKTDKLSYSKDEVESMAVELVNINTADVKTLCSLPNIGESTAQRIISYREKNGLFQSVDEIQNVYGIGYQDYIILQPLITVQ